MDYSCNYLKENEKLRKKPCNNSTVYGATLQSSCRLDFTILFRPMHEYRNPLSIYSFVVYICHIDVTFVLGED